MRPYLSASFDDQLDQANNWLLARARATARARISNEGRSDFIRLSGQGLTSLALDEACNALKGIIDSLIKFFTEA